MYAYIFISLVKFAFIHCWIAQFRCRSFCIHICILIDTWLHKLVSRIQCHSTLTRRIMLTDTLNALIHFFDIQTNMVSLALGLELLHLNFHSLTLALSLRLILIHLYSIHTPSHLHEAPNPPQSRARNRTSIPARITIFEFYTFATVPTVQWIDFFASVNRFTLPRLPCLPHRHRPHDFANKYS